MSENRRGIFFDSHCRTYAREFAEYVACVYGSAGARWWKIKISRRAIQYTCG